MDEQVLMIPHGFKVDLLFLVLLLEPVIFVGRFGRRTVTEVVHCFAPRRNGLASINQWRVCGGTSSPWPRAYIKLGPLPDLPATPSPLLDRKRALPFAGTASEATGTGLRHAIRLAISFIVDRVWEEWRGRVDIYPSSG